MQNRPIGGWTNCPDCGSESVAVIPPATELVADEEDADGKVWVNCWECDERFLAYYRKNES